MGASSFDHDAGRKLPPSSRFAASILLAIVLAGAATWAMFGANVRAAPPRSNPGGVPADADSPAALVLAAESGNAELLESMLARGVDPNAFDDSGQSALCAAIRAGETQIARRLLLAGAKLSDRRRTPPVELHLAAAHDDAELIDKLIDAGAAVDQRLDDQDRGSALHVAGENGMELTIAALLRFRADIDALDGRGFTPLARAVLLARTAVVKQLVERRANLRVKDLRGRDALQLACAVGDVDSVRVLLAAGADARSVDEHGWSALHQAAARGRIEVVRALVAVLDLRSLNVRTLRGATALHLAARRGDSDCTRVLLNAGADARIRDIEGRVARDLAPREAANDPWTSLGPATASSVPTRPGAVLLDSAERRPLISVCSRSRSTLRGPQLILDLAIFEDGAVVFAPWSSDGTRDYVAGALPPSAVQTLLLDLEECGWFDDAVPPLDPAQHDRVELTIERGGAQKRIVWDELAHPEQDGITFSRAALADWSLGRSLVTDVLRGARPAATQAISFVLVRGQFRGLAFEHGAHAAWME